MYIVIPCYNEPNLLVTLQSIAQCTLPENEVKVLVIVNQSETESEQVLTHNQQTFETATLWAVENSTSQLELEIQLHTLPKKHAGVGLARRVGMDIAANYYLSKNTLEEIIVCLDADCTVAKNYLVEIEKHFAENKKTPAASIYFEHDLKHCENEENKIAILNYELFLRYYIEGLRVANYRFAYHTIGSSMAVRAEVYKKQGGMNKRKAGEDFYFLHKIMPLGNFSEINTTTVYPSSRASNRVPFGTGKAVNDWYKQKEKVFYTYNPVIFDELEALMQQISRLDKGIKYKDHLERLPVCIIDFLGQYKGEEGWQNAHANSADNASFRNRYMLWWDGFKVLKLVHFLRDKYYPNILIQEAALQLLQTNKKAASDKSLNGLLMFYREIQRK
jgi:glycosyltransferase involved in cell wall biosynthesis